MLFSSWLRNRLSTRPWARRATSRPSATFRPQLESLDERVVPTKIPPAPPPTTWTVTNNLDSGAGSLRAEIAAASPGDVIAFAPGLAGQTIQLTSDELLIDKSLTIQGPGAGLLTVSGGNAWRVFEVRGSLTASPTVQLSGLTITQGKGQALDHDYDGFGGGVLNDNGGTLTISGCTVSNNHVDLEGGGVGNSVATLKIINSTLSGNTAFNSSDGGAGGALYNVAGPLSLIGCTLSNNSAGFGGAIYGGGTMTISGCTLSGNSARGLSSWGSVGEGGAIYNVATATTVTHGHTTTTTTNLTVSDSTFSGNYVLAGGTPSYWYPPIAGPWTDGGGNTFE